MYIFIAHKYPLKKDIDQVQDTSEMFLINLAAEILI